MHWTGGIILFQLWRTSLVLAVILLRGVDGLEFNSDIEEVKATIEGIPSQEKIKLELVAIRQYCTVQWSHGASSAVSRTHHWIPYYYTCWWAWCAQLKPKALARYFVWTFSCNCGIEGTSDRRKRDHLWSLNNLLLQAGFRLVPRSCIVLKCH